MSSKFFIALTCLLLTAVFVRESLAGAIDVEFSAFTIGDTFPSATIPRTITTDSVDIAFTKYNNSTGANGRIVDFPLSGSPNNALFLAANLRAQIVLPGASNGGFFFFRNSGGTNLLEINGQTLNFYNSALAGSDFASLGGVSIHSAPLSGAYRSVKLDGWIESLAFIGQELTIDSVQLAIALPGDYNLSETVDAADYVLWRNGGPLFNDATSGVQPEDYHVWQANFGNTTGSGASIATIPEPSTLLLIIAALAGLTSRRCRSHG